jgi:ADP-ribose pyrophosphatase YjhB (NUDIX family)
MSRLHGWRVCPRCGASLERGEGRASCPACGSVYYANAAPTASALLLDADSRLLLARRAVEPYLGMWDTIGGFLDETETPEEALVREVAEETGLDVGPGAYVGTYVDRYGDGDDAVTTLNLVFEVRADDAIPRPADDVAELAWFPLDELPPAEEFAFHDVGRFVHEWAERRQAGARS